MWKYDMYSITKQNANPEGPNEPEKKIRKHPMTRRREMHKQDGCLAKHAHVRQKVDQMIRRTANVRIQMNGTARVQVYSR